MKNDTESSTNPIISPKFAWRLSIIVGVLVLATLAINIAGQIFSKSILTAGHTPDRTIYNVQLGNTTLGISANTMRFDKQRRDGLANGVNLYFAWPEFEGYSASLKDKFNTVDDNTPLIFVNITKSEGNVDMSARFNPIYTNFLEGVPKAGPDGLVRYKMSPQSSYNDESLYVEEIAKEKPFVIKCLQGDTATASSSTGCQRDVNYGDGLTLSYRYSEHLLPEWRAIEQAILNHIQNAVISE